MNLNWIFSICMLAVTIPLIFGVLAAEMLLPHALDKQETGAARLDGAFSLIDDTGATVTQAGLTGKPTAIYFGYTHCLDACPTTLANLSRWIQKLGLNANKLNFAFVSVDSKRDSPQVLHAYLSSFDHHIRGYTGTPVQIAEITRAYRVDFRQVASGDRAYLTDHSAGIYLIGPDGRLIGSIADQEDDASAITKLNGLASFAAVGSKN